ncbi:zinc-dependent metalloprotease [Halosquirtibacter laminarini]|uniref:Zinc-dependent metalloprotease n=1 Tax=Halosquirtibacter laminarini TaxID=3374600 RepID=A0AC61ND41_9BACT|nr:zinc-dependent metalloprotease [Prolixibacteraceae bacterium]
MRNILIGSIFVFLLMNVESANAQFKWFGFGKKKQDTVSVVEKTPYEKKFSEAEIDSSFVDVLKKDSTSYYFQIPLHMMDRDLLVVNKLSKVPEKLNDAGLNQGIEFENLVVQFHLNPIQNKVYVMNYEPFISSPDKDNITKSVRRNYTKSILEYFKIEAYNNDSSAVVVKVNKIYDGSEKSFINVFGKIGIGTSPTKSYGYISKVKAFPKNILVKTVQTTKITGMESQARMTVEVTSNLVLLPKKPMTPRFADERVGFFSKKRWYFNDKQQEVEKRELISRWRLEPRDPEAYARGELVEPKKQIVYYIDPATPKQWQQPIIDGVKDWNVAFEKAGFKNAITCKIVTEDDKDFDIDDVRYSVITYAASDHSNAMGPSVVDPRSGEIIEADVIWWHNVLVAVQDWMRVQTGIIDSKSRDNVFSDEHMGDAVRFVSSHEIGHTLGLAHNMGASFSYDVDSLRSKSFTAHSATAPSIMDYARFNYVAQSSDHLEHITPKIGVYDKFAIGWGYHFTGVDDAHDEITWSRHCIEEAYKDLRCHYLPQQGMRDAVDPRAQIEDLGDNAVKASELGLVNLKKTVPLVESWTTKDGDNYVAAGRLMNGIIGQWHRYSYHVLANIGGVYQNNVVKGDGLLAYQYVPGNIQRDAVKYLEKNVLTFQPWLFHASIYKKVYPIKMSPVGYNEYEPTSSYYGALSYLLWDLLSDTRLHRMTLAKEEQGHNGYGPHQMLFDLYQHIFKKTIHGRSLNFEDRMIQKSLVDALIISSDRNASKVKGKKLQNDVVDSWLQVELPCFHTSCDHSSHSLDSNKKFKTGLRADDIVSCKRGTLLQIEKLMKIHRNQGDTATRNHYEDLILRINQSLRD